MCIHDGRDEAARVVGQVPQLSAHQVGCKGRQRVGERVGHGFDASHSCRAEQAGLDIIDLQRIDQIVTGFDGRGIVRHVHPGDGHRALSQRHGGIACFVLHLGRHGQAGRDVDVDLGRHGGQGVRHQLGDQDRVGDRPVALDGDAARGRHKVDGQHRLRAGGQDLEGEIALGADLHKADAALQVDGGRREIDGRHLDLVAVVYLDKEAIPQPGGGRVGGDIVIVIHQDRAKGQIQCHGAGIQCDRRLVRLLEPGQPRVRLELIAEIKTAFDRLRVIVRAKVIGQGRGQGVVGHIARPQAKAGEGGQLVVQLLG